MASLSSLVSASFKKDLCQGQLLERIELIGRRLTLIMVYSTCRALDSPRASMVNVVRKSQNKIMTSPKDLTQSLVYVGTFLLASLIT